MPVDVRITSLVALPVDGRDNDGREERQRRVRRRGENLKIKQFYVSKQLNAAGILLVLIH